MSDAMRAMISLFEQRTKLTESRPSVVASRDADALAELDALVLDLRSAELVIHAGYSKRDNERQKLAKWKELVPQCRAALDDVERLRRESEKANIELGHRRDAERQARERWEGVAEGKPGPDRYPTPTELAKHAEREAQAKKLHSEAFAKMQEARNNSQLLLAKLIDAQEKLGRLQFEERNYKALAEGQGRFVGVL
jgi:hypothetical protein